MISFMIQPFYLEGSPLILIGQKAGWALEPVWTRWRKEKSLSSLLAVRPKSFH